MPDRDSSAKRVLTRELLTASQAGRIPWTGTSLPECYQAVIGGFVLAIRPAGDGLAPTVAMHYRTGHLIDVIKVAEGEPGPSGAVLAEIYDVARHHALGLGRTLRWMTKEIVAIAAKEPALSE